MDHKLNPYRDCYCLTTRRLSRVLTQHYDERLARIGLKITQFSVLVAISTSATPGREVELYEIANALDMDASTLSRIVKTLTDRSLVKIRPGEDRRARVARLTEEGKALLERAMPLWSEAQKAAAEKLGMLGDDYTREAHLALNLLR